MSDSLEVIIGRVRKNLYTASRSDIESLCDYCEAAGATIERLTRQRNNAKEAACWLYESDGDAHDMETARQRWPWIMYRREGKG